MISPNQYRAAQVERPKIHGRSGLIRHEEIFIRDQVIQELTQITELNRRALETQTIQSSLDVELQAIAQGEVRSLRQTLKLKKAEMGEVESTVVIADLDSGAILAMIGGADAAQSQFNRATNTRRRLGSMFLPLLYGLAFERGASWNSSLYATDFGQASKNLDPKSSNAEPTLYDGLVGHRALESTRLAALMGLGTVAHYCKQLGLGCEYRDIRLAAGQSEENLLGVAQAFGCMARGGQCVQLHLVERVIDEKGTLLHQSTAQPLAQAVSDQSAFLLNRGLSQISASSGLAGYSGHDESGHNLWSVVYDKHLLVTAWMGAERGRIRLLDRRPDILDALQKRLNTIWRAAAGREPSLDWLVAPPRVAMTEMHTLDGVVRLPHRQTPIDR